MMQASLAFASDHEKALPCSGDFEPPLHVFDPNKEKLVPESER